MTLLTGKKLFMVTVRLSAERLIDGKKMRSPLENSATVLLLIVVASSDSENVSMMRLPKGTSLAPSDGVIIMTCGGVVSGVSAVVTKLLWKKLLALPARSETLKTETRTRTLAGNGDAGVKVTAAPLTAKLPAT